MTVWLGTAAGSKRIDLSLEKLLQAGQTKKIPGLNFSFYLDQVACQAGL